MNFKVNSNLNFVAKKSDVTLIVTTKSSLKKLYTKYSLSSIHQNEVDNGKNRIICNDQVLYVVVLGNPMTISEHANSLSESLYGEAREKIGALASQISKDTLLGLAIDLSDLDKEQQSGVFVGLELGLYRFQKSLEIKVLNITAGDKVIPEKNYSEAIRIGVSINQARHLVNLPPNQLNPVSYATEIKKMYSKSKTLKVEVMDEKRLEKEKCGLLLGVGNSSNNPPRIVKIKYTGSDPKAKTITFVGKGLTFDSGGLDIKPAAGMRLMKKDMGGSATLIGLSRWLEEAKVKKNIEIYVALAENSISDRATRPSDILTSRTGHQVEIHNTDAEGRLALADAISIALDQKPEILIDVATLTGAGKVSLGQDIASLFCNDDKLANKLLASSTKMSDLSWRMPLYTPYEKDFSSDFADFTNAGTSGFAGSITAALFLEKFITDKTKWAHFDIFSWTSGAKPSLVQKGGSGQSVETFIDFLSN